MGFDDFVIFAPFTGPYFLPFICSVQTKKGTDTVSVPLLLFLPSVWTALFLYHTVQQDHRNHVPILNLRMGIDQYEAGIIEL